MIRIFSWSRKSPASSSTRAALIGLLLGVLASGLIATVINANEDDKTIRVVGRLTDEGVECQAMRDEDDKLYTLVGDLAGFKAGDKVVVEGRVARFSTCMQGDTLTVETIEKAPS